MSRFNAFEITLTICYLAVLIISTLMLNDMENQLNKQKELNEQLKRDYETLKINYDDLEIDLRQDLLKCELSK